LDIIVGGQGCSSSWSITRETSPPAISAPGRGRYAAPDRLAHCNFKLSAPGACSCSVVEKQTDFTPYTRFNLVVWRQIAVLVSQMRTEARRIATNIAKLPDLLG
jgi:hypothetical protein